MGCVQARFVEVLDRVITALVPRIFALFLFDELVDGLGCKRMSRPLLARRNGPEPFPSIDIQTDGHGDCGGGHGVHTRLITL